MSVWWFAAVVAVALIGLVGKLIMIRFLERMHKRGGREDMLAAAEALKQLRSWQTTKALVVRRARRTADPPNEPKP